MINCIIIEDERIHQRELESFVKKTNILNLIGSYKTVDEALILFAVKKIKIDLMLVDIHLRDSSLDGFEFVKSLSSPPYVIFITSHTEFSLESWRLKTVVDFIEKGCGYNVFLNAVLKLYDLLNPEVNASTEPNCFYVKDTGKTYVMKYDDILLVEGNGDYIRIHYLDFEGRYQSISPYLKLENIISQLKDKGFSQIHSSFIINDRNVDRFEDNFETVYFRFKNVAFVLNNKVYEQNIKDYWLPIGEKYRNIIKEKVNKLIIKRNV